MRAKMCAFMAAVVLTTSVLLAAKAPTATAFYEFLQKQVSEHEGMADSYRMQAKRFSGGENQTNPYIRLEKIERDYVNAIEEFLDGCEPVDLK